MLFAPDENCARQTDPIDAIRGVFWRVYEFSRAHPEYFALMFVDRRVPSISQNWERFGFVREMKAQVGATIQRAIDAGLFPAGSRPEAIFLILMTAVSGAAMGRLCNRTAPGLDVDALARDTLEATLAGLRAGIPITFHPPTHSEHA